LPDLPVYLLWEEKLDFSHHLFNQFEKWATKIIFDSELADHLPNFANTLLARQERARWKIADLNWARIESWRELFSSTFDSEERLHLLQRAKKINLIFNAYETEFLYHTQTQAFYLQAWLATRLDWVFTSSKELCFEYQNVIVELLPKVEKNLPVGTVISVEIFTEGKAYFLFVRDFLHPDQVKTILCDDEKCEILSKYIFNKVQAGLSLVNEIYHTGSSFHFKEVLKFFSSLQV